MGERDDAAPGPVILLLAAAALAGQVTLSAPPSVRRGIAAYPRIAAPLTPAAQRINRALAVLDAKARQGERECRANAEGRATAWERHVHATMRGPQFLSFMVEDDVDCGGAHPDSGHEAIVYDLATGAPVDWAALLSPRLAGAQTLTDGPDGVRTVTLDSPRLRRLYAARYDAALRAEGGVADCLGTASGDGGTLAPMQAWLDARRGALMLQYDLPHVMQACSVAVAISAEMLRREGASARLTGALLATRRGGR